MSLRRRQVITPNSICLETLDCVFDLWTGMQSEPGSGKGAEEVRWRVTPRREITGLRFKQQHETSPFLNELAGRGKKTLVGSKQMKSYADM